jgi:hypothetical protein
VCVCESGCGQLGGDWRGGHWVIVYVMCIKEVNFSIYFNQSRQPLRPD